MVREIFWGKHLDANDVNICGEFFNEFFYVTGYMLQFLSLFFLLSLYIGAFFQAIAFYLNSDQFSHYSEWEKNQM